MKTEKMTPEERSKRLAELMEKHDMTSQDVADRLYMSSRSIVNQWVGPASRHPIPENRLLILEDLLRMDPPVKRTSPRPGRKRSWSKILGK